MTETIKALDKYIKESEAILKKDNDLTIKEQIVKIKRELGFDDNLDSEYGMLSMCSGHSLNHKDKQILISLINRIKNHRAKLADEYDKQQNDYQLDKKRNRLTIIVLLSMRLLL